MPIRQTIPDTRDGEYYFDEKAARKACKFFPKYLRLFEGEWAGKPFELMPWQAKIIGDIFGWKRTKDGTRRYRVVYVWIPRKNTKSTTAAGIALLLLMGDAEPAGQVYCIARTEDQARIVFDFAGNLVANSEALSRAITPFKTALWCDSTMARMLPLTGKAMGKHGLNAHGIIGDEIHEWPSDDLYTFVHQSEGTRRQPMDFLISTAGQRDGVGWEHWQLCEAILNGEIDAPDTYVYIAAADPKRDQDEPMYWSTEECMRESNPGLGTTVKLEFLMAEIARAKQNPRLQNDIKRYYANLWVDQATVWLDMAKWDVCAWPSNDPPELDRSGFPVVYRKANMRWSTFPERLRGRRCLVGIDLSATTDLTCVVYLFPPSEDDPMWYLYPRFFLPAGAGEADMEARKKRDRFDYQAAADLGALVLTEGEVVDYDAVRKDIAAHAEIFQIDGTGVDPWNALGISSQLIEDGHEVEFVRQGYASMSGPSKYFEMLLLRKGIDHGGHPVLRWCARNVAITKDASGNMKPAKDKSTGRIDGIVAGIISVAVSEEFADERSVYEKHGVLDANA